MMAGWIVSTSFLVVAEAKIHTVKKESMKMKKTSRLLGPVSTIEVGGMNITVHRTVRLPESDKAASLPPNFGNIQAYRVSDYEGKCPAHWNKEAFFIPLHDVEAVWFSFGAGEPCALLMGAGGINVVSGEKLGTRLAEGNYMVNPPQPWIDGFKSEGSVYQFVATAYRGGKGETVAEQMLGTESKTGAIGFAVFKSKKPLVPVTGPGCGTTDMYGDATLECCMPAASLGASFGMDDNVKSYSARASTSARRMTLGKPMTEMGLGKGAMIDQKIYPDPYGLDVWQETPLATAALYIVSAQDFTDITGIAVPAPTAAKDYLGKYFGLADGHMADIKNPGKFDGLKTVTAVEKAVDKSVFPG
jgi:hypothetical protein